MPEGERVLSQLEVDALLRAINAGEIPIAGRGQPGGPVTPIDFRRPQRLGRRDLRAIQTIHEPFAGALRELLGPVLRAPVEAQLAGVEQTTLAEFADAVSNPTAMVGAVVEPGGASLLLEIDPALAFPLVERMLGAGGPVGAPPERGMREMEWQLLDRVVDRLLDRVAQCWAGIMVARLKRRGHETDPQAARALVADEALVRIGFLVESEGRRAGVNLCLPSSMAERLVERSAAATAGTVVGHGLAPAVAQAEVAVAVRLAVEGISLADLEALAPGDVLVTGQPVTAQAVVEIGGAAKLAGRAGALRGRRALLVEDWLDAGRAQRASEPGARRLERRPARKGAAAPDWTRVLAARVELRAVAAAWTMTLREVLELRPGAVVGLPMRPGDAVALEAGGRPFAAGAAVRSGDRVAVQIASIQEPQKTLRALA